MGTFATLREARSSLVAADRRSTGSHERTEDCATFAQRSVDDYPRAAPAAVRTYRYALRQFAEDFAGVPLSKVGRPSARAWALQQPQSNVPRRAITVHGRNQRWSTSRSESVRKHAAGAASGPERPDRFHRAGAARARGVRAACSWSVRARVPGDDHLCDVELAPVSYVRARALGRPRQSARRPRRRSRHPAEPRRTGHVKRPKNRKERVVILPPARGVLGDIPPGRHPVAVHNPTRQALLEGHAPVLPAACANVVWSAEDGLLRTAPSLRDPSS